MTSLTAPVAWRTRGGFLPLVASAPALLLLAQVLPETGVGLGLRLAGAAACVLLVPGTLVLRALGWRPSVALEVAGGFAVSLAVVALGLALVFAFGTSILMAGIVLAAVSALAAPFAVVRTLPAPIGRDDLRAFAGVLGLAVAYACVLWWAAGPLKSDGLFHAARVTKLAEFDSLPSLTTVDEFKDGGLHPGYVFPLWHAVDALVARLAGVDAVTTSLYLPAILIPLALVFAYAAGAVIFRSPLAGLGLAVVHLGQFGLVAGETNPPGTGFYENLSWPRSAAFLLVGVALLALAFAYVREGSWRGLLPVLAASFALTAMHVTYAVFLALVIGGFLLARVVVVRAWDAVSTRAAVAVAAVVLPFLLYLPVLVPLARQSADVTPSAAARAGELAHFRQIFSPAGSWVTMSLDAIAHGGPLVVVGFLAIPFAALAARRTWSSLVLGGTTVILAVLLAPPILSFLADYLSLSQMRRLPLFLPLGFATLGAAAVVSRFRMVGVLGAGTVGILLTVLYGVDEPRSVGPGWVVIAGAVGAVAGLVAASLSSSRGRDFGGWALAGVIALVLPTAVVAFSGLGAGSSRGPLTPETIAAVREDVPAGAVVFSDPETAFTLAAYAPVYINASPRGYVAPTTRNQVRARIKDAKRFLQSGLSDSRRASILKRWGAGWVLVDRSLPYPREFLETLQLVFEDSRFALYRVGGAL